MNVIDYVSDVYFSVPNLYLFYSEPKYPISIPKRFANRAGFMDRAHRHSERSVWPMASPPTKASAPE